MKEWKKCESEVAFVIGACAYTLFIHFSTRLEDHGVHPLRAPHEAALVRVGICDRCNCQVLTYFACSWRSTRKTLYFSTTLKFLQILSKLLVILPAQKLARSLRCTESIIQSLSGRHRWRFSFIFAFLCQRFSQCLLKP